MTKYINTRTAHGVETIDEFPYNTREERKEAKRCLNEYNLCMGTLCYLSSRPTKDWK